MKSNRSSHGYTNRRLLTAPLGASAKLGPVCRSASMGVFASLLIIASPLGTGVAESQATTTTSPAATATTSPAATTTTTTSPAATTTTSPAATTTTTTSPAATTTADQVTNLGNQVTTLGAFTYPDTFAGSEVSSSQLTIQLATASDESTFEARVQALNTYGVPVNFVSVQHSWSWFNTLMGEIAGQYSSLTAVGIHTNTLLPQYYDNSLEVNVLQPSQTDEKLLAGALGLSSSQVSSSFPDYAAAAQRYLTEHFGPSIFVLPSPQAPLQNLSSRTSDNGSVEADQIADTDGYATCTSGFATYGAVNPNNHWTLTAGHCAYGAAGDGWWIPGPGPGASYLGPDGTNYLCDGKDDVQTIGPNSNVGPYVWGGRAPQAIAVLPSTRSQVKLCRP